MINDIEIIINKYTIKPVEIVNNIQVINITEEPKPVINNIEEPQNVLNIQEIKIVNDTQKSEKVIDNIQKLKIVNDIIDKPTVKKIDDRDFEFAERLTKECLSIKRASNYENWIRVFWCLTNIDYRLEDAFIDFSIQ